MIPGTVTTAVGRQAPGEITLERLRGIVLGRRHPLSTKLDHAFQDAHLNPKLFENTDSMKWSKLLTNLIANASSAILGMTPDAIYSSPALFRVEAAMLKEALAVMNAQGIPVTDLPGTPVKLLATAIRSVPHPLLRPLLKKAVVGGRGEKMPSFYIDMQAGRKKSEVDFLNGAVVRFGEKTGVATPSNRFLTETLGGMINGVIPKDQYRDNPGKFLKNLKR